MKKQGILFIFFVLLFSNTIFPSINTTATDMMADPTYEILHIATFMDKNEIQITEWSIYTRGFLNKLESIQEFDSLKDEITHKVDRKIVWDKSEKTEQQISAKGTILSENDVSHYITLIAYPEDGHFHTYLIYEINGSYWNETIKTTLQNQYMKKITQIFHETPLIFSCAKGQTIDKMDVSLYQKAEEMLSEFSAKKVEKLVEKEFVSVSAYTENFKQAIYTQEQKMNIQISLRDLGMGGTTAVTIGTPIITSEY